MSYKCERCEAENVAHWLIGTARFPVCDTHHRKWLLCFSLKYLNESRGADIAIEKLTMPIEVTITKQTAETAKQDA
jgi:hypothetical protein